MGAWFETESRVKNPQMREVMEDINSVLSMAALGPVAGNVFWADNGAGTSTSEGTYESPFDKIETAFANTALKASNGDCVIAKAGHIETVITGKGLNPDKIGTTVVFLGNGSNRAQVKFASATSASMGVDAAGITLIGFMGIAGVDALTGPVDINAADCTMVNAEWRDAANKNAVDCIVGDANADRFRLYGWRHIPAVGGTQKQSSIQIAGANNPELYTIRAAGDFATGIIENGTAWIDAILDDLILDNQNATPKPAIVLQATSTGTVRNANLRVASGSTYISDLGDMQYFNCWGTGTDGSAGEEIGTVPSTSIEGRVIHLTSNVSALQTSASAIVAALYGAGGIPAFPAAAAAATNVSLAEVVRYLSEKQLPRTVTRTIAAMTTALYSSTAQVSQFNVTGDVLCWAVGVVQSALTSQGNSATISLGTTDGVAALIAAATVNGTNLVAGDVWFDATSGTNIGALPNSGGVVIGNGANIILRVAASNMTAGAMKLYVRYVPLSANGAVAAI